MKRTRPAARYGQSRAEASCAPCTSAPSFLKAIPASTLPSPANVPVDQVRIHICWGNYEGPHDHDIELARILPAVLKVKARAILFEGANPRHEHEWTVWRDAPLPDDLILIPGVIDSCSNYVEHPELVAQRIVRFAQIVGRERVIAGTDCGFGTFAGLGKVDAGIAFKKLGALVQGAKVASQRLWP